MFVNLIETMNHNSICPLCNSQGEEFFNSPKQTFYKCGNCEGIFLSKEQLPTTHQEKQRYELHENNSDDSGYRAFVLPIVNSVLNDFNATHVGLDFGSGKDSSIVKMLRENNYNIIPYDPFFANDASLLTKKYDYIVCCEVMEHFHNPNKEFELLKRLLKPQGKLYCMTHIYSPDIDFEKWYYKNDPTHVFIYQNKTLEWIKNVFGFSEIKIEHRLITFTN